MVEFHVVINGPDKFFSRSALFLSNKKAIYCKISVYSDTKDVNGNLYSVK